MPPVKRKDRNPWTSHDRRCPEAWTVYPTLTVRELREFTGFSQTHLENWRNRKIPGGPPFINTPEGPRYPVRLVLDWLAGRIARGAKFYADAPATLILRGDEALDPRLLLKPASVPPPSQMPKPPKKPKKSKPPAKRGRPPKAPPTPSKPPKRPRPAPPPQLPAPAPASPQPAATTPPQAPVEDAYVPEAPRHIPTWVKEHLVQSDAPENGRRSKTAGLRPMTTPPRRFW